MNNNDGYGNEKLQGEEVLLKELWGSGQCTELLVCRASEILFCRSCRLVANALFFGCLMSSVPATLRNSAREMRQGHICSGCAACQSESEASALGILALAACW